MAACWRSAGTGRTVPPTGCCRAGHVDPEDQNLEAALSREISEDIAGEATVTCSRCRTCDPPRPRKYLVGPEGQRSRTTVSVRNREVYIPNGPWCVAGGIAYDTMNDAITAAP